MENLGQWYADVVQKAELADYGPNKGDIVIRPYGMAIWKAIVSSFCERINNEKYFEAYFPLLIPESFIEEETKCIHSLSPRMFSAIKWGERQDESEKLVIRATSETIINYMFSKWINSYRDLPLKLYQVSNILRWEEVTHPFLKGREIQWIEGHAVFGKKEDALHDIEKLVQVFSDFYKDVLAIPICSGEEPQTRKFVGSERTITFETVVKNSKSLQVGAIYDLGKIFSKMFSVQYRTENNSFEQCLGVNWGLGFRLVGALALVHGDERGLKLPPKISPVQVVIIPINNPKSPSEEIIGFANALKDKAFFCGIRAEISLRRFNTIKEAICYWETRGVPLILPIGEKELKSHSFSVIRRDLAIGNNKYLFTEAELIDSISSLLNEMQDSMYKLAYQQMQNGNKEIDGEEISELLESNWAFCDWCGENVCEQSILSEYGKIFKCILPEKIHEDTTCCFCGKKAHKRIMIAKTY